MMDVWDPKDKPTVLSQIKKAICGLNLALWGWGGMIVPGVLTIFVFIIFFFFMSGCSYFLDIEPPHRGEPELLEITDGTANTIACIKLQPECKLDQQD